MNRFLLLAASGTMLFACKSAGKSVTKGPAPLAVPQADAALFDAGPSGSASAASLDIPRADAASVFDSGTEPEDATAACEPDGSCVCPITADIPKPGAWTRTPGTPLLLPGQSHADGSNYLLADPSGLYDETAAEWRVWYAASRGTCFTCENSAVIETARSTDGLVWNVQEEVALGLSGAGWDAIRTETPDVIIDTNAAPERRFVMAYSGAAAFHPLGFPDYNIGIAFSGDGKTFTRVPAGESPKGEAGWVLSELDVFPAALEVNGGVVADPSLALVGGVYHLWFSSFGCADGDECSDIRTFGVSHATSTDAVHWTPDPNNPILVGAEQPSVSYNARNCQFEMWFTDDAAGEEDAVPAIFNPSLGTFHAVSTDGSDWKVDATRDFSWDRSQPGEELGLLTGVDVAFHDDQRMLFYVGMGTTRIPDGFFIPVQTSFDAAGYVPGTFGLGIATVIARSAPH